MNLFKSTVSLFLALLGVALPVGAQSAFRRGDANADGQADVSDAVVVLVHLFRGETEPPCLKSADSDDSGLLDVTDAVYLLLHLFAGGPAPPEPFSRCGADPTADSLSCKSYAPCEWENLTASYGILQTVAGKGEVRENVVNSWEDRYEGGPAIDAELSRPHIAMADEMGEIYIADKDAHAIRKVIADGTLHTVAGNNRNGDDGDAPGPATQRRLSFPNGLWVRRDGTLYILDVGNSKVRRVDRSGIMTTLFQDPEGIIEGRGLWINDGEKLAYFSSGQRVRKWTLEGGVVTAAAGFADLGNLHVDPDGNLVVTDRGANRVYRIDGSGRLTPIAGNGLTEGGGDGEPALETGLSGVRGVWFLENGGYFLATHEGDQVWYVDTSGLIHLFLNGGPGHAHSGDGKPFNSPGQKVSEVRAVTVDHAGNVIVTENDYGYIRVVQKR